jgi:biotin carboxyl carrier protein
MKRIAAMKRIVLINGREFELELSGTAAKQSFRLGSTEMEADIQKVEPGVYSVLLNGRSYEVRVEDNASFTIFLNGRSFEVEVRDPRRWTRSRSKAGAQGRQNISAPMPGKIVRILIAPGDTVAAGQGLIVVEAMKMQNEMKASKGGVVVSVDVREGDTVNGGQLLAVIE